MSLTSGLQAALSGLQTAQRGLDLTAHNVANVNTEGYTRKIFNPQSQVLGGVGVGVMATRVTRNVDQYLQRDLQVESGTTANLETLKSYYERIQDLLGRPQDDNTISHVITSLAEEFELLAADPTKSTQQATVVRAGEDLARRLNDLADDVQQLRQEADNAISSATTEINNLLQTIADLNNKIVREDTLNANVADYEDQRDKALLELSEYLDINYYNRGDNMITVFTSSGQMLLSNNAVAVSHSEIIAIAAEHSYATGNFDGIDVNGRDITSEITSGKLAALIEMRDTILPNLQAQLDELAERLRAEVNAAHNRGTAYPYMANEMTGSRSFADPTNQTVSLGDTDDVVIAVTDTSGNAVAQTTLRALIPSGSDTVANVAAAIETWLQGSAGLGTATVAINGDGKMEIDLGSTTRSLAFRDFVTDGSSVYRSDTQDPTTYSAPAASTLTIDGPNGLSVTLTEGVDFAGDAAQIPNVLTNIANAINGDAALAAANVTAQVVTSGTSQYLQITDADGNPLSISGTLATDLGIARYDSPTGVSDATINFDSNGDGTTDQSVGGFSNFFGLNDFFTVDRDNATWDSHIKPSSWTWTGGAVTLDFVNGAPPYQTVAVANGDSLQDIATKIDALTGIKAEVVPEGSGYRLRIVQENGQELAVAQQGGTSLVTELGLEPAALGTANAIAVRPDLAGAPERVARGALQVDSSGSYYVSRGDNTVANQIAAAFAKGVDFEDAGGLTGVRVSLSNFAASIVSDSGGRTEAVKAELGYRSSLRDAMETRIADTSAVNLDEEVARLIVFQQAYSAAARVISTTHQFFQILNDIIR